MSVPATNRWLDRTVGAIVGGAAVFLAARTDPPPQPPPKVVVVEAPAAAVPVPVPVPAPEPEPEPEPAKPKRDPEPEQPAGAEQPAGVGVDAAQDRPETPLPRMPGANRLHGQRKQDDDGSWVTTTTYEVPSHLHQAEGFYRSALAEAGLKVSGGKNPDLADGAQRVFLRGRGERARADVQIRQNPGKLDTRVRILWREWNQEGAAPRREER